MNEKGIQHQKSLAYSDSNNLWLSFLNKQENLAHADRSLRGESLTEYIESCISSTRETVSRIKKYIPKNMEIQSILEVGSSTGFNCLALQEQFPEAKIIGIEPEEEAILVARRMAMLWPLRSSRPSFIKAKGESIPVESNSVDLIICHTVLEHVESVPQVISEMVRVLSRKGIISLEAPNYLWPREPHLDIWCIPLLGKSSVKFFARLQNKKKYASFVDHLQFITPFWIESLLTENDMAWENKFEEKLKRAIHRDDSDVKHYKRLATFLAKTSYLSSIAANMLFKAGLYPSLIYKITHKNFES